MRYYLSVEQTDLRERRARWKVQKQIRAEPRVQEFGTAQAATDPPGGLVALVDDSGQVERSLPLWGPEGIIRHGGDLLVACPWQIVRVDSDLTRSATVLSEPWCNYLHSFRATQRGLLVASTGVDAIVELDDEFDTTWQWWATEHGYPASFCGPVRDLDRSQDHRGLKYDTPLHTTHVNSAAELDDESVLATLFHQGVLVEIDRASGRSRPVLRSLLRPHAVRVGPGQRVTLADTGHGRAIRGHFGRDRQLVVDDMVEVQTHWLQDACLADDCWLLSTERTPASCMQTSADASFASTSSLPTGGCTKRFQWSEPSSSPPAVGKNRPHESVTRS